MRASVRVALAGLGAGLALAGAGVVSSGCTAVPAQPAQIVPGPSPVNLPAGPGPVNLPGAPPGTVEAPGAPQGPGVDDFGWQNVSPKPL